MKNFCLDFAAHKQSVFWSLLFFFMCRNDDSTSVGFHGFLFSRKYLLCYLLVSVFSFLQKNTAFVTTGGGSVNLRLAPEEMCRRHGDGALVSFRRRFDQRPPVGKTSFRAKHREALDLCA